MSPLWREQIRIVLCPEQVALVRLTRGWAPRIGEKRVVACDAAKPGEAPWRRALAALETALPEFGGRTADAVVILSNHFVRYALVTDSNQIGTADEEQALVRHSFAKIYGAAADHWALRLNDADGGYGLRVASAVDQDLQESLRALFQPTKLKLRSIQPYLMAAFNHWRHRFNDSAWFALVEQGRLCLAKIHHNQWHYIKAIKISDDWFRDVAVQLDRERLLSSCDAANTTNAETKMPVFLFAPGCAKPDPARAEELSFRLLRSALPSGDAETAEAPYAMALIG